MGSRWQEGQLADADDDRRSDDYDQLGPNHNRRHYDNERGAHTHNINHNDYVNDDHHNDFHNRGPHDHNHHCSNNDNDLATDDHHNAGSCASRSGVVCGL